MSDRELPLSRCGHDACKGLHVCNLDGLWWGDEEWPEFADGLWREYVARMHEWKAYENAVATVLGSLKPREVAA